VQISDKAEEILEELWIAWKEKDSPELTLEALDTTEDSPETAELLKEDFVNLSKKGAVSLSTAGKIRGEEIVRHHRLAERLLADVLDMPESIGDEAACRIEHALKRGLDERICTLLGHPRFCPHGSAIPPGPCCKERRDSYMKIVSTLSEMEKGERGIIAYLHTGQKGQLERLLALGVLPGQPIVLIQKFPSFVFRVGETEIAVDKELAGSIYVRLGNQPPSRRRWQRRGRLLR